MAGEYCGKLLADLGADIIKVERPGWGVPPGRWHRNSAGASGSGLFAYLNTNKRSAELDPSRSGGADVLHDLIATADAVIDDHGAAWTQTAGLTQSDVTRRHPGVVFCSITPYGQGAPPELQNAKSLNVFHGSGWGYHTPSHADPAAHR